MYDYLIVGAGLYGATFAERARAAGKRSLVIERRDHIGGNCYTEKVEGIDVHCYGAHIFHTNHPAVWAYVNRFAEFNNFVNSPVANYKGQLFNLPFNMNTFHAMWGVKTPAEAQAMIERQRHAAGIEEPSNLEEQAVSLVGHDIYEMLVKGYTEKQWGRPCRELPASIIKRLPVRLTFDNNYFNARWQGIPERGYTALVEKMLEGTEVCLSTDFLADREHFESLARKVVYTGPMDAFFDFCFGPLEYRSLKFKTRVENCSNYQGVAVMNYTDRETPYTRVIEHKHFNPVESRRTVVTEEYPATWTLGDEPFYPVNDARNATLFQRYLLLAEQHPNVIFGGRLGQYRYFDMDKVILEALMKARAELGVSFEDEKPEDRNMPLGAVNSEKRTGEA